LSLRVIDAATPMTRDSDDPDPDRRALLAAGGSLAALLSGALSGRSRARSVPASRRSRAPTRTAAADRTDAVFPQGVASGDPTPDGVVLWTRIAPDGFDGDAGLSVELAADAGFDDPAVWDLATDEVGPERDHTAKVDLAGELSPGRTYHYRFVHRGVASPVGRCRTLPAPDASPDRVAFAVLTCQDYRNGYYPAYHHVARADVDYLLHLGDFIYEHGGPSPHDGRGIDLPSGAGQAMGLDDFRHLHRTYRSDRFLRQALASHPLIATWDDHEIVNNRYWDYEADRPAAGLGAHPRNDDPAFMRQLFADGIRAWWEYMPARVSYDPDADLREQIRLYRSFRFGDLLTLAVTDERLHRSSPTGGTQAGARYEATLPGEREVEETILGARQRRWFLDTVTGASTTWVGWANEVLNADLQSDAGRISVFNADSWDGYEAERRLLMDAIGGEVENFVALSGDLHTALAGFLRRSYDETAGRTDRVGVELMTPAVTSANLAETLELTDPAAIRFVRRGIRRANPHLRFFNSHRHGYAVVEFAPDGCTYTAYGFDKSRDSSDVDRDVLKSIRVPAGEHRLEDRTAAAQREL
jgi:alkaline phosphatase D